MTLHSREPRDTRTQWGEPKRQRTLSLTDTCWDLLTDHANAAGTNRSDWIEQLTRSTQSSSSSS
jgi:hypothetical protein